MKFISKVILAVALSTVGALATQDASLSKEDEAFWGRFLEGDGSLPTPAPVVTPKDCFVEVDITCVAEDGTECVDLVPPRVPTPEDCIVNVCYTIVITNTGEVCMDITVADLDVNGDVGSVLDLVPINPLCPDDGATSFETCGDIDICSGGEFCAIINVEADPPNGMMCQDDDEYKFNIPTIAPTPPPIPAPTPEPEAPCFVEVGITCTTEDGTECVDIVPPAVPSEETCIVEVCYAITIDNTGDVCMEVTVADLDVNGNVASILDDIELNPICVGESTTIISCGSIDICNGGEFCANINVEANPPNGEMCQDDAEYKFTVPTPSPTPAPPPCVIELSSECTIAGNSTFAGQDCEAPLLGVVECMARPTAATMLYNGGGCEQSDNTQELKFTCMDMNGGPPVNPGEQSYIVVTDIKGNGITYFEGLVEVYDSVGGNNQDAALFALNDNGERFEADMFVTIYTPDQSTVLQMVQYHSSCSSNLELKNRFGAAQLVEFFNDEQGLVSCFQTLSFAIDVALPIAAMGSEPIELTSMTAMTSFAGDLDLTDQVAGMIIGPDNPSIVVTLMGTINAAERQRYTIAYSVQGVRVSDGAPCTGMDMISFEAGFDPNAAPVASPTTASGSEKI